MMYYYGLFVIALALGIPFFVAGSLAGDGVYLRATGLSKGRLNYKKAYVTVLTVAVAAIVGLRAQEVGLDTIRYIMTHYQNGVFVGLFEEDTEIVADILAWIAQRFTKDPQLFLVLNGVLVAVLFGKFIHDSTDQVALAVLVFLGMFFVQSMNLMREWLAIGFGLNAYTFYRRKETKKALLMLLLAALSHLTAIVLLFIPLFDRAKNKKQALTVTAVAGVLLVVFQRPVLRVVTAVFPQYSGYMSGDLFLGENAFNIKNLIFIAILCYLLLVIYQAKEESEKDVYRTYAAYLVLAISFSFCGGTFNMMHRLAYYYSAFLIMILPQTVQKSRIRVILEPMLAAAMFVMLARNAVSDNNGIANYTFFWK